MEQFVKELQQEMRNALEKVSITSTNSLQQAERSYFALNGILRKLREFIHGYEFRNKEEEIRFFKEIRPFFSKELIFHNEYYHLEANRPIGDPDVIKDYYRRETERVRIYLQRNQTLYNYYRSGHTGQDQVLFTRNGKPDEMVPEYTLDFDPLFSTVASLTLAKILAFEELHSYLLQCLQKPEPTLPGKQTENIGEGKLKWTYSKAGLIELIYGMQFIGAINNGNSELRQIVTVFEKVFHIDLGNVYRTFYEMGLRKKTPTPCLDKMKDEVIHRMDENNQ